MANLRGERVVSPTAAAAAQALAKQLAEHLEQRLVATGMVHLALSGGSSGALLCDELASSTTLTAAGWSRVHLWMVDERCVPEHDPRLNFALLRDRLAPRVGLPLDHLHPMPVLHPGGAAAYQKQLEAALATPDQQGRLDAVVLGMGPDGHTASLFPHSPALQERTRAIVFNDGDAVTAPRPRMTMTYPTLNGARLITLLVTGASKRAALASLVDSSDPQTLPVAGIVPGPQSRMIWYLDQAALPP